MVGAAVGQKAAHTAASARQLRVSLSRVDCADKQARRLTPTDAPPTALTAELTWRPTRAPHERPEHAARNNGQIVIEGKLGRLLKRLDYGRAHLCLLSRAIILAELRTLVASDGLRAAFAITRSGRRHRPL